MADIIYSNTVHPTEEIALDALRANLQPKSVMLRLVNQTPLPGSGTNRTESPKDGTLVRAIVAELGTATAQAYSETKTRMEAVKSVVSVNNSVESIDFARENLPSKLGTEAAKAFAVGLDTDIGDLFISSSKTQAHTGAGAGLKLIDILSASLKVRTAMNGEHGVLASILSFKQAHQALGVDILALTGTVLGNANNDLGGASATIQKPAGLIANVLGIDIYQCANIDIQNISATPNFYGAVLDPARALIGMWGKENMLKSPNLSTVALGALWYMYSDFAIHWDESICSLTSPS